MNNAVIFLASAMVVAAVPRAVAGSNATETMYGFPPTRLSRGEPALRTPMAMSMVVATERRALRIAPGRAVDTEEGRSMTFEEIAAAKNPGVQHFDMRLFEPEAIFSGPTGHSQRPDNRALAPEVVKNDFSVFAAGLAFMGLIALRKSRSRSNLAR
jgi:hypothetical protein